MTVGELLDRASSAEIEEWKVIMKIEHSERDLERQHRAQGL